MAKVNKSAAAINDARSERPVSVILVPAGGGRLRRHPERSLTRGSTRRGGAAFVVRCRRLCGGLVPPPSAPRRQPSVGASPCAFADRLGLLLHDLAQALLAFSPARPGAIPEIDFYFFPGVRLRCVVAVARGGWVCRAGVAAFDPARRGGRRGGGQWQPPTLTSASTPRSVRAQRAARRGWRTVGSASRSRVNPVLSLRPRKVQLPRSVPSTGATLRGAHLKFCHLAPDGRPERAVSLGVMRPVSQVA